MMQEEELVQKDELTTTEVGGRRVLPFHEESPASFKSSHSHHEIVAALIMTLSAISGGLLEGYASPAIPSMIICNDKFSNPFSDFVHPNHSISNLTENVKPKDTSLSLEIDSNLAKTSLDSNSLSNKSISTAVENSSEIPLSGIKNASTFLVENTSDFVSNETISNQTQNLNETENDPHYLESHFCGNSSTFHLTEEAASWFGSLLLLGAFVGALSSPWVIMLGRRHNVLLSALPRFIGWVMIAASPSVVVIDVGRFLTGISIGMATTAAPIYISEISHPSLRGSLSCLVQLGVNFGIFLASLFGTFLNWRQLAIFGSISVWLYFIPTLFIPNSPSWLVWKGREKEARRVLTKLRSHSHHTEEELQQIVNIVKSSEQSKTVPWKDLVMERRCRLPLLLVVLVTAINRFSGYNAIITYCATFLHQAVPSISHYWGAVAIALVQIFATAAAIPLVDRLGRRKLLLVSTISMGTSLCLLAIFEYFVSTVPGFTWLVLAATMIYVSMYSIGIGPLTWVLLGEMFPLDARDRASAVVAVLNWFAAFIVTKTYFSLETFAGVTGTCLLYSSVCFLGSICIYFLIPETKGRTLAEIEAHFSYQNHSWKPFSSALDQALSSILEQEVATIDSYSTFH